MKIECEVKVKQAPRYGMETTDCVRVTLDGNFDAIMELLRKLGFNADTAKELMLQ